MTSPLCAVLSGHAAVAPASAAPWIPDLGDGTYKNPVLFADYSDPDAIRVGDDFYLVASSFLAAPGLPILHSTDLVNWTIVNHVFPQQPPVDHFSRPRHGQGVWAPALRYHAGKYWITYPDPDFGIYLTTATDPAGAWTPPELILPGRGLIDPCPFWDDDGQLYLIHGWAKSRAGIANLLTLRRLSPDGRKTLDAGQVIIDANKIPGWSTLEGPKLYKRHGYYYVFAPAGGVATGYQAVFRAKHLYGPYEHRIVLAQGSTAVNGPHQGAWVDTPAGEDWFLHFQDRGAFGRVVHLQPMAWHDDWPVIGLDADGDGTGEPVLTYRKPHVSRSAPIAVPQTSDAFDRPKLGLQWQWNANPQPAWFSLSARAGFLRLNSVRAPSTRNDGTPAPAKVMRFGSLEIDRDARTVTLGGTPTELTSYQFDLLVVLAERAGRVLTRDQIMEAVRGRELEAFDRSIDVHMGRIRAAIEADPKNPKRILTVRGVGYVFAKQQD